MDNVIDKLLVVQGAEYRAVQQGIKQINLTTKSGKIPQVIAIPIGEKNATKICYEQLSGGDAFPKNVLIMGLCGSLSPQYSVGDIVLYQGCLKGNSTLATDENLTAAIKQQLNPNIPLVTALTSDRVINSTQEKKFLAQAYPATVIDMEGFTYLQTLADQGVSVAMLRIVSDDIHYDIPDLNHAIDQAGNIQTIPLIISILRQPRAAIRLIRGSLQGLQVLKKVAEQLVEKQQY